MRRGDCGGDVRDGRVEENGVKFCVFSLGCKVNQYEGQSMISYINSFAEHEATAELCAADCYILNTCSVTAEADKKSRQAVARVLRLNPNARVFICGCSSQNSAKQYENKKNVKIIGGSSGKMELVKSIMSDIIGDENNDFPLKIIQNLPNTYEDDLTPELTKARAYIKVQDGCNNFCSYCIVPYLRGRSRSRSLSAIIEEAKKTESLTEELVITGINVSAYGQDNGSSLIELVKAMGEIKIRKRFGSLECRVLSDELLSAMKESGFCDSFHLSMQSGSDEILKKMNRKYTSEFFIEKSDLIRKYFPDAGLTTDVIVGFPGESEEHFSQTIQTCKRVGFFDMHVFPYSIREGTAAAKMQQVDKSISLERAARLRALASQMKKEFLLARIGNVGEVFVEEVGGGYGIGHTSNFIKVYVPFAPLHKNIKVKLTALYADGLTGEIL